MSPCITNENDSTVSVCGRRKYDTPENLQIKYYWGNIDFHIQHGVFVNLNDDSNMSSFKNKFILSDLLRNISITRSFAKLPVNWNDNGAIQFTNGLIDSTIKILRNLDYQPEVFPTARASILLEFGKPGGEFLGIEVFENRIETFIAPQRETASFDLRDAEELRKMVNEFND